MSRSVEEFITTTRLLLDVEKEAEIAANRALLEDMSARELQRRGVCLTKLVLSSQHTGLYGRTVLTFEARPPFTQLVTNSFSPGDIAGLNLSSSTATGSQIGSGIVSRVSKAAIGVAFDRTIDSFDMLQGSSSLFNLLKLANDVTHKRLKRALDHLEGDHCRQNGRLVDVLFGQTSPEPPVARDGQAENELVYFNDVLDDSQKEAVQFALGHRASAIIHGPPGTGKTTTVTEIVRQAVKQKLKVLVCAPSNIAVDNLVERLADPHCKLVRLGHPARVLPHIQRYSLDAILAASDETKLVVDVRKDIDKTLCEMRGARDVGSRHRLRSELKALRREQRQREEAATRQLLQRAYVVMATLTGASMHDGPLKLLRDRPHFDLVVIDECSQATEAACWVVLPWAPRCVLAGDHNQLPPTIISTKAAKEGLAYTLMERLLKLHGSECMRMLRVQYRMHADIMRWPSDQLYSGQLVAHPSVASHLLQDIAGVQTTEDTATALLLIDTAGCNMPEEDLAEEVSKANEGEVDLVAVHTDRLISSGLAPGSIAIIAPYNLQVELLRLRISQKHPAVEIKSVDGFQGREKEAVIISMVRSNERGQVGFLAENRRINVAITRARRHLAVICDSETVGHDAFLRSLVAYLSENGESRCAQQYIDEGALISGDSAPPESFQRRLTTAARTKPKSENTVKTRVKKPKKETGDYEKNMFTEARSTSVVTGPSEPNLEATLTSFLKDTDNQSYRFPPSLNSHDRLLIHQIAERLGLLHFSEGDGRDRQIVVGKTSESSVAETVSQAEERQTDRKAQESGRTSVADNKRTVVKSKSCGTRVEITTKEDCSSNAASTEKTGHTDMESAGQLSTAENAQSNMAPSVNRGEMKTCVKCGRNVPLKNVALHALRCGRPSGEKDAKPVKIELPDDAFDALIADVLKQNTTCAYTRCRTKTTTLGLQCVLCARRFCLAHHVPEAHGCGEGARAAARAARRRPVASSTSASAATRRNHLQRRLGNKLGEMEAKRKPKK